MLFQRRNYDITCIFLAEKQEGGDSLESPQFAGE